MIVTRSHVAGVRWYGVGSWVLVVYSGQNLDVGEYYSLNLFFSVATATRCHNAVWSW